MKKSVKTLFYCALFSGVFAVGSVYKPYITQTNADAFYETTSYIQTSSKENAPLKLQAKAAASNKTVSRFVFDIVETIGE